MGPLKRRGLLTSVIGVGLICGVGGARYFDHLYSMHRLETAFRAVQLDMSENDVAALFESDGRAEPPNGRIWWNDRLVRESSCTPAKEVWYSPRSTFLFPVSFVITFDQNGKVVGKHRYD